MTEPQQQTEHTDEQAQDQPVAEDAQPPVEPQDDAPEGGDEEELLVTPGMNWFVLRVASNKEDSVRATLLRKIKIEGYEHLVNRILVPTEKTKTIKGGKQRITQKKLYPGYVFVEMKLEDDGRIPQDVFFLIKETTGVGDFIGTAGRPSPMSVPEIEKMLAASKEPEEAPTVKMEFQKGDAVKIKEGPFENMEGTVDELLPQQGKVRVIVTIFGRATPVELEYWLIEKSDE
jgi:transcriptional antiterminator NusG